ncbi:MAG: CmcJ/NvfI family oxidoreductase, partial [Alphaproteobacteria bacterium]
MSNAAMTDSDPSIVEAELNYIVDDGKPSIRYIDWPEEEHKARMPVYQPRTMTIANGRVTGGPFTLPDHGFTLVSAPTAVIDFFDEEDVKRVYYPETEALIKAQSGAKRVVVFDHTLRTADPARHAQGWIRNTVKSVHNDYTERSAPKRLRDILPADEAEAALKKRYAIIQVWRSVAPRVETEPLALCDGATIPATGFISNQRRYRDRTAETYHIAHNPAHKWYYFPLMTRDEALVFKVFDTDPSAGGG